MRRIALSLCSALAFGCAQGGTDSSPRLAEGGGFAISLDELDAKVKDFVYAERTEGSPTAIYDLRAEVLDELIEEHVLASEAKRRGLDVEALLEAEAATVTAEEVQAFFEEHRERLPDDTDLEEVEGVIRGHLGQEKVEEAIAGLIESAGIAIHLDPPRLEVAADGPSKGPENAAITIIEFSDFQCPFCRRAGPVIDELLLRHPEDLRVVYRHFPLESIHARARPAAEASGCAEDQGRFWEFHDRIFENPNAFADEDLRGHAEAIGLDLSTYDDCISDRSHREHVTADLEAARGAGINGTPAFLVNGVLLSGVQPIEAFERVIRRDLRARALAP